MLSVIISPHLGSAMTRNAVLQTKSEHHKIDARSTDRRKIPNDKTPHIAGTTGGKQTCETDDPEEFSSFLDSFLCRKNILRKNPPQRRRWNRPRRQEDTEKDQYAGARARRKEGHDHQINLLRTANSEYSGLQLAQKKRKKKKKKSCESRELTSADRPWLERGQAPLERKIIARQKRWRRGWRRRTTEDDAARQTTGNPKRKKLRKKAFFANFFSFSFPRKKELHPRRKIYSSSYGEGGGNVGTWTACGDFGVRWSLRPPWNQKNSRKNMAKMWSNFFLNLNKIRHYLALN